MARDPRAIHDAEQLLPWTRDAANILGTYYRSLQEQGVWTEAEITLMVRRLEYEMFGYPWDPTVTDSGALWDIDDEE